MLDLDASDDDVAQLLSKRLKVENAIIFVAVPRLPVLDGYASNSGGAFRDDFDDAASVTISLESLEL